MMATSNPALPTPTRPSRDDLRGPLRLAAVGFAVFIAGAAMTMSMAGLFNPLLLLLAALINLILMLPICLATAAALEIGARRSGPAGGGRSRIARRTLNLAAMYWSAAGLAFLLSPFLARL